MAQTRLLELEITQGKFGPLFTKDQQARMELHIRELRRLLQEADTAGKPSAE